MVDSTQKFSNDLSKQTGPNDGSLQMNSILQSRYRISGILGVGGMGSVYLARDLRFPNVIRNVAVKEMLNMQADPALRELTLKNFGRESDVLASLNHPAVPEIYDYFATRDRAYLVMEYIDGKDLEVYVTQTSDFLPVEMVRKWAIELCDILGFLHTHQPDPIIFRDVKPSNIMIDKQGRVRLIDFGIAKPFQPNTQVKATLIGTEGYSAPEQYRGEASPASDIFALGATLHHLLTKRDPRVEAPFTFPERPIRVANPKVSPEFEAIVMKALNTERRDRYQSASDMKAALEALDQPAQASRIDLSAGSVGVTDEFAKVSVIKPLWTAKVEDEIRSTPVVYKNVVYIGTYDNNLYGFNVADGKPALKFATHDGIPGTPAISEEDNLILFGSEDHKLYAMDFRNHKVSWEFEAHGPIRSSITVAHSHAFFGCDNGYVYALRLSNGKRDWEYAAGIAVRSRPAVTDDRVIFGTEGGDLLGLDLGGSLKWRFKAKRAVTSSPVIHDKIAYFGGMDGHVYAVEVDTGWSAWKFRTGKPIVSSPTVVDNVLYIGSADGYLYALDIKTNGKDLWKFKTGGQIVSTPTFHNGAIYFGSTDKVVYSLDARKGQMRWQFETNGAVTSSAAVLGSTVFIGSTDKTLYALNA